MPSAGDPAGGSADPGASPVSIGPLQPGDWQEVRRIFVEGIASRDATFESEAPSRDEWEAGHLREPRLAARRTGKLVGWAVLSPFSTRACYAGVAEVSIYVAQNARGRGIGKLLLTELVRLSEAAGIWTLQAGIFPENAASLALHEHCGFRVVGVRRGLGQKDGVFRDVVLLERRSAAVEDSQPPRASSRQ